MYKAAHICYKTHSFTKLNCWVDVPVRGFSVYFNKPTYLKIGRWLLLVAMSLLLASCSSYKILTINNNHYYENSLKLLQENLSSRGYVFEGVVYDAQTAQRLTRWLLYYKNAERLATKSIYMVVLAGFENPRELDNILSSAWLHDIFYCLQRNYPTNHIYVTGTNLEGLFPLVAVFSKNS